MRGRRQRLEAAASPGAPRTTCLGRKLEEEGQKDPPLERPEEAHPRRHLGFRAPASRAGRQVISIVFVVLGLTAAGRQS